MTLDFTYQAYTVENIDLFYESFKGPRDPDEPDDSDPDPWENEKDEDEDEDRGPALELYGTDLTELASLGQLDDCFGRDQELLEMMEILVRRQKNNPVLVGDAGVGKTAIIELFATKIVNNLVPFVLEGRSVVSLDLARIVAGSRYRGEFELRFQRVLDEVLDQPHIIIFIDEIHNIGGTGSAEGSLDAANILKPVLSRSGFQCIGATTTKEYQKIEKDPALNRRFQPIKVKEPSIDDTVKILYGLRPSLEAFHNVEITPAAIKLSVDLAARYIYDRFLPDKAIDLLDRAAAKEVIKLTNVTERSVLSSIVNASLNNIGSLRLECFRRGDIGSEFIFQEIENAYRSFLLRWIESPLKIPEEASPLLSPIGQVLFDDMRLSILTRVDELLFASSNARQITKHIEKNTDLSVSKNQEIYLNLTEGLLQKSFPSLSLYRISVFLFTEWIEGVDSFFFTVSQKQRYLKKFIFLGEHLGITKYLFETRVKYKENVFTLSLMEDFILEDMEIEIKKFEVLSELEEKRIQVFIDFISDLKPLIRKGLVESLQYSSEIEMSEDELGKIYSLLGYFSTQTGKKFLYNPEDPELISRAKRLGDFTGLKKKITQREIRELLSTMTGIPIQSITNAESEKLMNLEATLHKRVIGQNEAISAISKAIRRSRLGIQNPNRPIASFLFCGPTGVGKTEVTKALAATMFGAESDMIRFDMSEFMEKFTISRLIGSPPGYVGYDDGGQLTDSVRQKPYSVVLFDEVEKAHPDILNVLLQILEDGRLTDSQKRLVPFDNTIIIMTSNAAAEEIQQIIKADRMNQNREQEKEQEKEIQNAEVIQEEAKTYPVYEDDYAGAIKFLESPITENFLTDIKEQLRVEFEKSFRTLKEYEFLENEMKKATQEFSDDINLEKEKELETVSNLKNAVFERLSSMFLPEFLNRLDDIIIFQPLREEELRKICDIMVKEVADRVKQKQIQLIVEDKVKVKIIQS